MAEPKEGLVERLFAEHRSVLQRFFIDASGRNPMHRRFSVRLGIRRCAAPRHRSVGAHFSGERSRAVVSRRRMSDDMAVLGGCYCHNAHGLLKGSISAEFGHSGVVVSLWGRNLADERYWDNTLDDGVSVAIPGSPRTYGATVECSFGGSAE